MEKETKASYVRLLKRIVLVLYYPCRRILTANFTKGIVLLIFGRFAFSYARWIQSNELKLLMNFGTPEEICQEGTEKIAYVTRLQKDLTNAKCFGQNATDNYLRQFGCYSENEFIESCNAQMEVASFLREKAEYIWKEREKGFFEIERIKEKDVKSE